MEQVTIGSKWTIREGSHFVVNDIVVDPTRHLGTL
jgi:hypothetical protein